MRLSIAIVEQGRAKQEALVFVVTRRGVREVCAKGRASIGTVGYLRYAAHRQYVRWRASIARVIHPIEVLPHVEVPQPSRAARPVVGTRAISARALVCVGRQGRPVIVINNLNIAAHRRRVVYSCRVWFPAAIRCKHRHARQCTPHRVIAAVGLAIVKCAFLAGFVIVAQPVFVYVPLVAAVLMRNAHSLEVDHVKTIIPSALKRHDCVFDIISIPSPWRCGDVIRCACSPICHPVSRHNAPLNDAARIIQH